MRVLHQRKELPNIKFTLAVEFFDISKSFQVSVYECGHVSCMDELAQTPLLPVAEKQAALEKIREVVRECVPFVLAGNRLSDLTGELWFNSAVCTGQKWVLLVEFWSELDRPVCRPSMLFRVFKGGAVWVDPDQLVLPLPGQDKVAQKVESLDISLSIAQTIFKALRWSLEAHPMNQVQRGA